ncbi:MAG: alanine racemase [Crocinitomicaceae bacterium]
MLENSYIEINITALLSNLEFIKSTLNSDCELTSVVKGNAYGHGIVSFVPTAFACGIRSFAVFSASEAKQVLDTNLAFDRILIMGNIDESQLDWAVENDIEFYVFEQARLNQTVKVAKKLKKQAKIHIEVETGLNRTGFSKSDLLPLLDFMKRHEEFISLEGLCSHLAGAENVANYYRIKKQINRFNQFEKLFAKNNIEVKAKHLACSAAVMNFPNSQKNLARIGIMQYGLWPSKEVRMAHFVKKKNMDDPLKAVLSWKSYVMSIKRVKMGEYIGYGSSLMAEKDMLIATVPVGYADGFARSLSNHGKVLIGGQRLDVVGTINMNLFMVDITNLSSIKKGDEVVLIGTQGKHAITVASFSDFSSQLNYELLTRLPKDIPRIITN